MRTLLTLLVGMIAVSPCLLIFNENGNIMPNLLGFSYLVILYIVRHTKVAKWAIKQVIQANKNIERWLFD